MEQGALLSCSFKSSGYLLCMLGMNIPIPVVFRNFLFESPLFTKSPQAEKKSGCKMECHVRVEPCRWLDLINLDQSKPSPLKQRIR